MHEIWPYDRETAIVYTDDAEVRTEVLRWNDASLQAVYYRPGRGYSEFAWAVRIPERLRREAEHSLGAGREASPPRGAGKAGGPPRGVERRRRGRAGVAADTPRER